MRQASIVLLLITATATALAQEQRNFDRSEATMGETIYYRYCAACHGREGRGDGPVAQGLVRKPIDLTALASKNKGAFPFDKVARSIDGRETPRAHGAPDMPVWGEVFGKTTGTDAPSVEAAVSRITHYVWSIQPQSK